MNKSTRDRIRERITAHNNEFKVGDIINFYFDGPGEEQEGELIEILDCVMGRVKMPCGTFRIKLSTAKIIKQAPSTPPPDYDEISDRWEPMDDSGT